MKRYEIVVYVSQADEAPFQAWIDHLKDKIVRAKLYARIERASFGNFGDWKRLKDAPGLFEMREHSGAGYRIYYSIIGDTVLLLLAGSTKQDQDRAIAKAKDYLRDYLERSTS